VVQYRFVDCSRTRPVGKRGKSGSLSRGDQFFGRPDVVRGGFCKEIGPVGGFCPLDTFEVPKPRLSRDGVGIGDFEFLGRSGGFRELFPKGGQEWGPPGFGPWAGARARRGAFYRRRECGEG